MFIYSMNFGKVSIGKWRIQLWSWNNEKVPVPGKKQARKKLRNLFVTIEAVRNTKLHKWR